VQTNISLQLDAEDVQANLQGPVQLSLQFDVEQLDVPLSGTKQLGLSFPARQLDVHLRPVLVGPPGPSGSEQPKSPVFTYNVSEQLTQIAYSDGSLKAFTYDILGRLETITFARVGAATTVKTLSYTPNGLLDSIVEV
jgi:hypothetical protein